eukprot:TRINITY_DN90777_c0_g1_i1.p1 TRINITY_DN90777_c0_g1~~TRINITY_DN90777_c0_g1_i1.p1  ORF type:complete len:929 (-),score=227.03 TRINITY_DN90777_c0_g1_i1:290-3076(-)
MVNSALCWQPRVRVLCLHGHSQTSATFEQKIAKLIAKAESFAEFVFVDGPVELPTVFGDRENTRAWGNPDSDGAVDSVEVLEALAKAWEARGPFDGVLGFSEGTKVAHYLCSRGVALDSVQKETAACSSLSDDSESCVDALSAALKFAIMAGGPAPQTAGASPLELRSMHFMSAQDTVVPLQESRKLAAAYKDAAFVVHEGGHVLPQRAQDIKSIIEFLEARRNELYPKKAAALECCPEDAGAEDARVSQDQRDELETLTAMFEPEELSRVAPAWPVRVATSIGAGLEGGCLRFMMPPGYPHTAQCCCEFFSENFALVAHKDEVLAAVEAAREPFGFHSLLPMVQAAQAWAEEHASTILSGGSIAAPSKAEAADGADDEEDDVDAPANAWWLREDWEVERAGLDKAEKKAAELVPDSGLTAATFARECGASAYGRPWQFVVGLVGKPSAGKSTFFNAATRPEDPDQEASMAPHPFTTIDPNIAPGWFAAPCPSQSLGCYDTTVPQYGRVAEGRRRHPLLVKDVAGLVPGAYMGRGRGNAFLNDLVDADALIHVVDCSGRSDREGVDQGSAASKEDKPASDPLDEVGWVRHEIHLWIFCNVRAKWDSVRKRALRARHAANKTMTGEAVADRLFALFSGYHASKQLSTHVYEAMGCSLANIADTVLSWEEYDLHLLVACFLRARFPIVVALNKVDVPGAADRVKKVQETLGQASCMPVCAKAEWWLVEQSRKGHLTYTEGGGADTVVLAASAPEAVQQQWEQLRSRVLEPFGRTGVLDALTLAVLRRRPIFICPVVDFSSFQGLASASNSSAAKSGAEAGKGGRGRGKGGGYEQRSDADSKVTLSTLVALRPASTVEEAFAVLSREQMLAGDFVRAELLHEESAKNGSNVRVLKKEDHLRTHAGTSKDQTKAMFDTTALVLRILTNKKAR